jgi:hypothetical protein
MNETQQIITSALVEKLSRCTSHIQMLESLLNSLTKEEEINRNTIGLLRLHGVASIYIGEKPYSEFLLGISTAIGNSTIANDYLRYVLDFDQMNLAMGDQQKENLKMCIRQLTC